MRRRLTRILLNAATSASVLLCLATIVICVRSQWISDDFGIDLVTTFDDHPLHHTNENVRYAIVTDSGTLSAVRRRGVFGVPPPVLQTLPHRPDERHWTWRTANPLPTRARAFSTTHDSFFHQGNVDAVDAITVPLWLPVAAFTILPAARASKGLTQRRRQSRGLCPNCNYDLRATPDRCPECGHTLPHPDPR